MVDEKKKGKEVVTFNIVVEALLSFLREMGYDMELKGYLIKYHKDIGILIEIKAMTLPDFPIGTDWLFEATGYDWLVNSIEQVADFYKIVFLMEEDI